MGRVGKGEWIASYPNTVHFMRQIGELSIFFSILIGVMTVPCFIIRLRRLRSRGVRVTQMICNIEYFEIKFGYVVFYIKRKHPGIFIWIYPSESARSSFSLISKYLHIYDFGKQSSNSGLTYFKTRPGALQGIGQLEDIIIGRHWYIDAYSLWLLYTDLDSSESGRTCWFESNLKIKNGYKKKRTSIFLLKIAWNV